MDAQILAELVINILHFAVLIAAIVMVAKKTDTGRGLFETFYMFGMVALALEDIYWLAYDFIRPGTRMPFAANEIACSAFLLLVGAAMSTRVDKNRSFEVKELVFSIVYMAVNAVFWIAWSGEWLENIVFVVPYIYYLYHLGRGLRRTRTVSGRETMLFIVINVIVFVLHGLALVTDERTANMLSSVGYIIIFSVLVYMLVKYIRLKDDRDAREKSVFLSFAILLWSMLVVYMSAGIPYAIALVGTILAVPVTLHAVIMSGKREKT